MFTFDFTGHHLKFDGKSLWAQNGNNLSKYDYKDQMFYGNPSIVDLGVGELKGWSTTGNLVWAWDDDALGLFRSTGDIFWLNNPHSGGRMDVC